MAKTELDDFQTARKALSDMERQRGNGPQTDLQLALGAIVFGLIVETAKLRHVLEAQALRELQAQKKPPPSRRFVRRKDG
jgi:hypothetical protein